MAEIQEFFARLVYNISLIIPLGYAFGAGMVSIVNPCGFAMLPAYLGLYLGSRNLNTVAPVGASYPDSATASVSVRSQLTKAVLVSLVITIGFIFLFGAVGIVISAGGRLIGTFAPWIALVIGGALVLIGIAMLLGRRINLNVAARLAGRLGNPGKVSVWGFFIFGVAYATASLSCTLPVFLIVVGGSLAVIYIVYYWLIKGGLLDTLT